MQPNPPRPTTVPTVLSDLKAGWTAQINDPSVPVILGLPAQWPESGRAVFIAPAIPGAPGLTRNPDRDTRTQGYRESYDINCAIRCLGTDGDMAARITEAGELWDACRTFIDTYRFGAGDSVVADISLGNDAWVLRNASESEVEATIGFTAHVLADI